MNTRLKSIEIEDFRSIKGTISISLDAPVVLIHGPNGTGKTSILSAIELGLTGAVNSLSRVDPRYVDHLMHKDSVKGIGTVSLTMALEGIEKTTNVSVKNSITTASNVVEPSLSRFFSERCFLAQSALGRLLEIYQYQDSKKADSALTTFVKDLLGLDQLDAVIEGLYSSGDVRRLKDAALEYWRAREDIQKLNEEIQVLRDDHLSNRTPYDQSLATLLAGLSELGIEAVLPLDLNQIEATLKDRAEDRNLTEAAISRRNLKAISDQWTRIQADTELGSVTALEEAAASSSNALQRWNLTAGAALNSLLDEIRALFSGLPSRSTSSIEDLRVSGQTFVDSEIARLDSVLSRQANINGQIANLEEVIQQGQVRALTLDNQIAESATSSNGLVQVLSEISPYIENENCPVCRRNFAETSSVPLRSFLSVKISELVENAGRLEALSANKATTSAAISKNQRELDGLKGQLLTPTEVGELRNRLARLQEMSAALSNLKGAAQSGASLEYAARNAAIALEDQRNAYQLTISIGASLNEIAAKLREPPTSATETINDAISRLHAVAEQREAALAAIEQKRLACLSSLADSRSAAIRMNALDLQISEKAEKLEKLTTAKAKADVTIDAAKDIVKKTKVAKTDIIRRVFNDELNSIWRDLFIRLAPDESFVPAFALPEGSSDHFEAALETHYRQGGKGGDPRSMLSAGNLNTAALTLFLSLHLSVKPVLPWLIIDDPVQSMDEVHISQFAALLRSLAKQKGRQVIIAVHERALFDYLTLELSPAFLDDRLITVELGRSNDGRTLAPWVPHTFRQDKVIFAA